MALKPCRECKKKISTEAFTCPNCGAPQPTQSKAQRDFLDSLSEKNTTVKKPQIKTVDEKNYRKAEPKKSGSMFSFVRKYWRGEVSLVKSFWLVGGILVAILAIPLMPFLSDPNYINNLSEMGANLLLLYVPFFYIALTIIYIGLWRSAKNYIDHKKNNKENAFWGYATYVYVILTVLNGLVELLK